MSAPKVVEVLSGYQGTVLVCTEADEVRYCWTATDSEIMGGSTITFPGIETIDPNSYRRQDDQWYSYTPEEVSQKVSDEIAAHLDLVEQAAAAHKSSGRVQ